MKENSGPSVTIHGILMMLLLSAECWGMRALQRLQYMLASGKVLGTLSSMTWSVRDQRTTSRAVHIEHGEKTTAATSRMPRPFAPGNVSL